MQVIGHALGIWFVAVMASLSLHIADLDLNLLRIKTNSLTIIMNAGRDLLADCPRLLIA